MIFHIKMPYEVPNDVIMYHEKRIEWNILISACMPQRWHALLQQMHWSIEFGGLNLFELH